MRHKTAKAAPGVAEEQGWKRSLGRGRMLSQLDQSSSSDLMDGAQEQELKQFHPEFGTGCTVGGDVAKQFGILSLEPCGWMPRP